MSAAPERAEKGQQIGAGSPERCRARWGLASWNLIPRNEKGKGMLKERGTARPGELLSVGACLCLSFSLCSLMETLPGGDRAAGGNLLAWEYL